VTLLPLFPLPNVVLFPGVLLPLHIFEPRYRALTADALDSDRRLGMVLLQPGWEPDYDGQPPIFPIGCSGVIVHAARLEDGRYNILLRGLDRFRIVTEDHALQYRRAAVETLFDPPLGDGERSAVSDLRAKLAALLGASYAGPLSSMPDADLVHTLAQSLDLEPLEKQALLERDSLCLRAQSLVELLEMKQLLAKMPGTPNVTH
jgi:Lon protease-like protein